MPKKKRSKSTITADRISDLPQPIIHQILSFLPAREAAQTSALSKTFYSSWTSFPVVDLNYHHIKRCWGRKFFDLVNGTIQRRNLVKEVTVVGCYDKIFSGKGGRSLFPPVTIAHMSSITNLKLANLPLKHFNHLEFPLLESLSIRHCSGLKHFNFSSSKKIRSITLEDCIGLHGVVIESSSLETFAFIGNSEVNCIDISKCSKSLKNLTLSRAHIEDSWIRNNLPILASLENLELGNCVQLDNPRIVNDNLKTLHVHAHLGKIPSIEIAAKNLQSLSLNVKEASNIGINSFMHLTDLTLGSCLPRQLVTEFLRDHVAKFILLETLNISVEEWSLSAIDISNKHLKRLVLLVKGSGDITIDTPKLVSFEYRGLVKPFRVLSSMNLLNAKLKIYRHYSGSDYLVKLWNFIRIFCPSKVLKLACTGYEDFILPKDLRQQFGAPIYDCKHVEIELRKDWREISAELVDNLLWLWPSLHTLCIVSIEEYKRKLIKFQCKRSTSHKVDPKKRKQIFIKSVELENFDPAERAALEKHFMK